MEHFINQGASGAENQNLSCSVSRLLSKSGHSFEAKLSNILLTHNLATSSRAICLGQLWTSVNQWITIKINNNIQCIYLIFKINRNQNVKLTFTVLQAVISWGFTSQCQKMASDWVVKEFYDRMKELFSFHKYFLYFISSDIEPL